MTIETRERFLRAIAERVAAEQVEEVHVFPALRQGGTESAVAVVAVRPAPAPAPAPADDVPADAGDVPTDADDVPTDADDVPGDAGDAPADQAESAGPARAAGPARLTVYRASYRLVLKGPDRGTWEVGVTEEADAPLRTVVAVVRGVHERSGGCGDDEPERLGGDAFRAAVSDTPWASAR